MKKNTLLFTLLILACLTLSGQDAKEIIRESRNIVKVKSFEATSTLVIRDGRGKERVRKNTMASKTYADQTEKRIIKFTSPPELKGTGILIFDHEEKQDDMWIYLSSIKKTRRIVSREKSNSFMGSEFSNADMTAPSMEDFTYELMGSESIAGVECWKIRSTPADMDKEDEYGYSSAVAWIGKNDYIVRQTKYYDYDGTHFKTIRTLDFKLLDESSGKYMVTEMKAENHSNGRSSSMVMEQIQLAQTKDEYFTISFLER